MGSHDAHYAGELVDGARILALFGDVATELLIRLDGDEGLFRAYDSVEFLAPVYAGDYIEARGVLTAVGNTSRRIEFEAKKVVRNLREPGRRGIRRQSWSSLRSSFVAPAAPASCPSTFSEATPALRASRCRRRAGRDPHRGDRRRRGDARAEPARSHFGTRDCRRSRALS